MSHFPKNNSLDMLSKIHLFIEIGLWSELVFVLTKKNKRSQQAHKSLGISVFDLHNMRKKGMKTMKRSKEPFWVTILSKDFDFGGTMAVLYFWKSQSKISRSPFITFGDKKYKSTTPNKKQYLILWIVIICKILCI